MVRVANVFINALRAVVAPNIPISPVMFSQEYLNVLSNALRLYFNQIDRFTSTLIGNLGGQVLSFPQISASSSIDQYADADDDPTVVTWSVANSVNGFTLNVDNTATALQAGLYKIDYSLQFANTSNSAHDVYVWLEIDGGTQVANSSSKFTLPARKSAAAGDYSFLVAYSSVVFELPLNEKVSLWWATDKAYNPTGPVDGVYMEAIAAQTSPYNRPANPSAIGSITFVSAPIT